jgi:hypothetical protein
MTVTIEVRDVSIDAKSSTGRGPPFARVTFGIKGDPVPEFEITFIVPINHGLDAAISDARALLEFFAADLVNAAKSFTFP